ncbi:MAG: endolytic transglycosylase MltG [Defluviimonas sp.]|nr:endolytic transglycosylase MltG [Defluviimonas sp.]
MWRSIASNFLTLAIVLLIAAGGLVAWGQRQFTGPGPLAEAICLRVEQGSSLRKVSDDLEARGAITSGYVFRVGADYTGRADDLKFGSYLIAPGASMSDIVDAITRGGQSTCGTEINYRIGVLVAEVLVRELDPATNRYVEVAKFDPATTAAPQAYLDIAESGDVRFRVTLAEGATSWQVVEALKRAEFLQGELGEVPPEGTLAPDSYEVTRGTARQTVLDEMARRQADTLAELWANRAEGLPYDTPEEALVMASLIEKETGVPTERRRVASVFVNRLRQGMRLQTDPAVIYGITKGQGALGRGLRQSELRRQTPFNTYVIEGLPPSPIANPGRESIAAALDPEQTDFLYFVADGSGGHAFASTLEEHNRNVARWREIEAQQGTPQGTQQTVQPAEPAPAE